MSERRETSMNMRSAVWGSKGMRRGNAGLAAVAVTALHLGGEHGFQEPLVGPVFGARPLGQVGQGSGRGRCLQRAKQVDELGVRCHAGIRRS